MIMDDQQAVPGWWRKLKRVQRLRTQFKGMGFNQGDVIDIPQMRAFLSGVADWAVEQGWIQEDPAVFREKFDRWAKREIVRIALQMGLEEVKKHSLAPKHSGEGDAPTRDEETTAQPLSSLGGRSVPAGGGRVDELLARIL